MRSESSRHGASRALASALLPLAAALLLGQAACVVHQHGHDPRTVIVNGDDAWARIPGPPPWAPAHGHRHEHREGVELRYDAGLGVYLVVGHPRHYFRGELFYRQLNLSWAASAGIDGPWWTIAVDDVPLGLRRSRAKKRREHPMRGAPPLPARHD